MTWRPLLEGSDRDRVLEALDEVGAALDASARVLMTDYDPSVTAHEAEWNLGDGRAGIALYYGYMAQAHPDRPYADEATALLEEAIAHLPESEMTTELYEGFTGVAWAAEHLGPTLFEGDDEDPLRMIDDALAAHLQPFDRPRDFDLISGLSGVGVYALERLPRPSARACLEAIVDRLDEQAQRSRQGVSWFIAPELMPSVYRRAFPHGKYDLGIAHGVAGVIALLGQIAAVGVARDRVLPLLEGAVSWLQAQRGTGDSTGLAFPSMIDPHSGRRHTSRFAWCYGDLGIAVALLWAAHGADNPTWRREALELARSMVTWPLTDPKVFDPTLCHGGVGLGHLFNRLYQFSGEAAFAEAARRWYLRGLELRRPGQGIVGFGSLEKRSDGVAYRANPGFLIGASGSALGLLAAVSDIEPRWDRCLLAGLPC